MLGWCRIAVFRDGGRGSEDKAGAKVEGERAADWTSGKYGKWGGLGLAGGADGGRAENESGGAGRALARPSGQPVFGAVAHHSGEAAERETRAKSAAITIGV